MRFIKRICHRCGRPGGTVAFRWEGSYGWHRDYFHPDCFANFKKHQHRKEEPMDPTP